MLKGQETSLCNNPEDCNADHGKLYFIYLIKYIIVLMFGEVYKS